MFCNGPNRTTVLDAQVRDGVTFGDRVILEPYCVIYDECQIGSGSLIGAHAVLRPRTVVGTNTIFGTHSVSEGDNYIGNNTTIHAQCHITKGLWIGDDVFIAPFFIASNTPDITKGHHGTNPSEKYEWKQGIIQHRVRIGVKVSMIPGITIGHDSLISQNCLITKDVPPYAHIMGGKDKIGRVIEIEPHELSEK